LTKLLNFQHGNLVILIWDTCHRDRSTVFRATEGRCWSWWWTLWMFKTTMQV